jgi:hypothetical protein
MKYKKKPTTWRWTTVPKYKESFFKPTFEYDRSLFEGLTWQEPNSKGTGTYAVTLAPKGFTCDCPGFSFRGKCKHSQTVNDRVAFAIEGEVPNYYVL